MIQNISISVNLKLKMDDEGRRKVIIIGEDGSEISLEDYIAKMFDFPSEKEFESQIGSLRNGEDAFVITRDVGKVDISIYKPLT